MIGRERIFDVAFKQRVIKYPKQRWLCIVHPVVRQILIYIANDGVIIMTGIPYRIEYASAFLQAIGSYKPRCNIIYPFAEAGAQGTVNLIYLFSIPVKAVKAELIIDPQQD